MNPWVALGIAALGLLGTGGGLVGLLTLRATRRKLLAQAAQIQANADQSVAGAVRVLIGSATDLVAPLQRELDACRIRLASVQRHADVLERKLDRLAHLIHDPYMTMDQLRVRVPDPATNGAANGSAAA